MIDDFTAHYNNLMDTRDEVNTHCWSKALTRRDGEFVSWLYKRLIELENEAFAFTPGYEVSKTVNKKDK